MEPPEKRHWRVEEEDQRNKEADESMGDTCIKTALIFRFVACSDGAPGAAFELIFAQGLQRLQGVGLRPEPLADRLLVKFSQPASKIETIELSQRHVTGPGQARGGRQQGGGLRIKSLLLGWR
eukprot:3784-Pelagomonas_calceolata.AAC.1